ncbi:MAG: hypothetical protein KDA89_22480, partial [Planctomycetaceae bacterium]|nr:hypothetical protein [Planctomycetaceae bacterium]
MTTSADKANPDETGIRDGKTEDVSALPSLRDLGTDLLRVSVARRVFTIGLPFLLMAGYICCALLRWWPCAV